MAHALSHIIANLAWAGDADLCYHGGTAMEVYRFLAEAESYGMS